MMRRLILLFILFVSRLNFLQAQEIPASAGGDITGNGGSAAFTAGQVVFSSLESATGSAAQGVQQIYIIAEEPTFVKYERINLTCDVYPNPTAGFLMLKFHNNLLSKASDFQYSLFDSNGNLLAMKPISQNEELIDMSQLAAAIYFLQVSSVSKGTASVMQSTFKIVKQ